MLLANIAWLGRDSDEITQIQLANQAKTDIMMTSQVLRTLEKKKLILRTPHTTDSRAKSITLTEEGLVLVTKAAKIVEQADMTFFGTLETQLAEFNKSMQKILEEAQ